MPQIPPSTTPCGRNDGRTGSCCSRSAGCQARTAAHGRPAQRAAAESLLQMIDSVKKRPVNPAKYSSASACPRRATGARSSPVWTTGSPPRWSSRTSHSARTAAAGTVRPSRSQLHAGRPRHPPFHQRDQLKQQHGCQQDVADRVQAVSSGSCRAGSSRRATGSTAAPMNRLTRKTRLASLPVSRRAARSPRRGAARRGRDVEPPRPVAERPAPIPAGEQPLDDGADRRVVDPGPESLHQPRRAQPCRAPGDPARHAGQREQGQPGKEEPFATNRSPMRSAGTSASPKVSA